MRNWLMISNQATAGLPMAAMAMACTANRLRARLVKRRKGGAVIGEVLVLIVIVALAVIFKSGATGFINEMWTSISTNAKNLFS